MKHILFHDEKQKTNRKTETGKKERNYRGIPEAPERFHAGSFYCDGDRESGCLCGKLQGNSGIFAGSNRATGKDLSDQHYRVALNVSVIITDKYGQTGMMGSGFGTG